MRSRDSLIQDKWNEAPPCVEELPRRELLYFLQVADESGIFSDWEREFCRSVMSQIYAGRSLSPKQTDKLNAGLLKKLWDENSDNWWGL